MVQLLGLYGFNSRGEDSIPAWGNKKDPAKKKKTKPVAKKITYVACTIFLLDSTALGWSGIEDREW